MKKAFTIIALVSVLTAFLSSCSDEPIAPRDGSTKDKCQFGGGVCN